MEPLTVGLVIANPELAKEVHACLSDLPVRILMEQPEIVDWAAFLEKTERMRPDVLLLGLSSLGDSLEEAVQRIRRTSASPVIVAVHDATEPQIILRAIRAGAAEYLYPPLNPSLASALERISSERAQQRGSPGMRGKTLAFLSVKGGCGATTVACHAAVELSRQTKQEVLLADFDLEIGILGFLMKSKSSYSVQDAVNNIHRLDLSFWKALISNGIPGLEIISAPTAEASRQSADQDRLRHILQFVRNHYDWIAVDLGRGLSPLTMNALDELDETFLVTTLDVPALYQAKHLVKTLLESGYGREHLHLILNRVPKKTEVTNDEIQQHLGVPVYLALPEDYTALYDCYAEGKLLPPNSNLGKHLNGFASKISGVAEPKSKRTFSIFG